MTTKELRDMLAHLELTQVGAAKLLGVDDRTMRRWCLGERPISPPAIRLLRLMHITIVRTRLEQMKE